MKPDQELIRQHRDALEFRMRGMDVLGMFFDIGRPDAACMPSISFAWDQWVQCTIICMHGKFIGVSDITVNFTEAYAGARKKWGEADHSEFIEDD